MYATVDKVKCDLQAFMPHMFILEQIILFSWYIRTKKRYICVCVYKILSVLH